MEGYKKKMINIFENFLSKIVNEYPETQDFIKRRFDELMGEIHLLETPEDMDIESCSSNSTTPDMNSNEVRKNIPP